MKKVKPLLLLFFLSIKLFAQVGINTTTPNAVMDIRSGNAASPTNQDGLLIPKIDVFPVVNPTAAQNGMLVFLTTQAGANAPGFYYWEHATAAWKGVGSTNANQWSIHGNANTSAASHFIGTIHAQDVIFKRGGILSGRIGITSTAFGLASLQDNTTGNFNTAFGAGAMTTNTSGYENSAVGYDALGANTTGYWNVAFGRASLLLNTEGFENSAYGYQSLRNSTLGSANAAFGRQALFNNTIGDNNSAFGKEALRNNTVGSNNSAFGYLANVGTNNLENATAIGARALVTGNNAVVLGSTAGVNGATVSANVGIGTSNPQERLHVAGNIRMVDGNQAAGRLLVGDANGTATWTNRNAIASGSLDEAYDFSGAGLGRTIVADSGPVTISGTDGLFSTGTLGSGATMPTGTTMRMVWNPRKGAFRAGKVNASQWSDANTGNYSVSFGEDNTSSGTRSVSMGDGNTASGSTSFSFGQYNISSGSLSATFGFMNNVSGSNAYAFGQQNVITERWGIALGNFNEISSEYGFAKGKDNIVSGRLAVATGEFNTAASFGETVIGFGATLYTPTVNGDIRCQAANATDRLFVIGNAVDTDNDFLLDPAERSNAMLVLKNGRVGLGIDNNASLGGQFQLSLDQGRKPATTVWTIPSDERLKKIHGNYEKGLAEIVELQPIRYHYQDVDGHQFEPEVLQTECVGFSAQEVQKIFPEAVGTDDDGYLNFNMHSILVASVNAIRELKEQNENLVQHNRKLQQQLESQQAQLQLILNRLSSDKK
ncbi:tail fiber domain-containing protein [Flavobacterium caeni]|uniref:Chaperone of endosialidase n=1 Tax=Flavobacterium caeni TaxID=490189 RepID=A0A1G5EGE0_9FLAO|nr:tail fiber domain-containing protein [Flavobacterium caeni]SCY25821.1 Chaperone of endosialidase [Flavobacterium caeni]